MSPSLPGKNGGVLCQGLSKRRKKEKNDKKRPQNLVYVLAILHRYQLIAL